MKKAVIIGATSGIGRELAKVLADDGYIVGITGRRLHVARHIELQRVEMAPVPSRVFGRTKLRKVIDFALARG